MRLYFFESNIKIGVQFPLAWHLDMLAKRERGINWYNIRMRWRMSLKKIVENTKLVAKSNPTSKSAVEINTDRNKGSGNNKKVVINLFCLLKRFLILEIKFTSLCLFQIYQSEQYSSRNMKKIYVSFCFFVIFCTIKIIFSIISKEI